MGGTQSLHTNSMDEALWLPTEKSVRTALRTQQIIAHESGVANSVDPLAGSYLVEYLTEEIISRAEAYIEKIDSLGGALAGIESGYIQNEIQDAAYAYQRKVETREVQVVGLNSFQVEEKIDLEQLKVDPKIEAQQVQSLKEFKQNRDEERIKSLMQQISQTAKSESNLMPLFIESVEAGLTLGEICNVLRAEWGEYSSKEFA